MSRAKRILAATLISALVLGVGAQPALASDHLAGAADPASPKNSPGNNQSNPKDVPGEGNPNAGKETGTPATSTPAANK